MTDQREHQLALFSALFVRTDQAAYEQLTACASWAAFLEGASEETARALAKPLGYDDYRHFVNRMLTPGIPGALPPVESLYKDWGGHRAGLQYGQGYYLGESALHVRAVCSSLGIEVPCEYQAAPDHVVLLLELSEYLFEHAPIQDALDFARSHFDWLDDYRVLLAERAATQDEALQRAAALYGQVIAYLEEFVFNDALIATAHTIVRNAEQEEGRSAEEVVLQ